MRRWAGSTRPTTRTSWWAWFAARPAPPFAGTTKRRKGRAGPRREPRNSPAHRQRHVESFPADTLVHARASRRAAPPPTAGTSSPSRQNRIRSPRRRTAPHPQPSVPWAGSSVAPPPPRAAAAIAFAPRCLPPRGTYCRVNRPASLCQCAPRASRASDLSVLPGGNPLRRGGGLVTSRGSRGSTSMTLGGRGT